MRRMFKRELGNSQTAFAALLAACALALGLAVFAAPDAAYALEGSGTEDDPFLSSPPRATTSIGAMSPAPAMPPCKTTSP